MAVSKFVNSGEGYVYIETVGAIAPHGNASTVLNRAIKKIAGELASSINSLEEDSKPETLSVAFGLKYSESGTFVITQSEDAHNFAIEMTFKATPKSLIPGF